MCREPWDREASRASLAHLRNSWAFEGDLDKAEELWTFWYRFSKDRCHHKVQPCEKGEEGWCGWNRRQQRFRVVHGSPLPVWSELMQLAVWAATKEKKDKSGCAVARFSGKAHLVS